MTENADLQALLDKGIAAANAGDLTNAEAVFREANAIAPGNPWTLHNLGLLLFNVGRIDEAELALIEAAKAGPRLESLALLAGIFQEKKRYQDALRCLQALLKHDQGKNNGPNRYSLHVKVAEVKGLLGDAPGEREGYRRALEAIPGDLFAATKYADLTLAQAKEMYRSDEAAAVEMLERALVEVGDCLAAQMRLLPPLAEHTEWHQRTRNGQPPYHAAHVGELFFRYGHKYIEQLDKVGAAMAAAMPGKEEPMINRGVALFCLGDRHGAEALFRSAPKRTAGHILETVKFAPEFYEKLRGFSDEDLTESLPPLVNEVSLPGSRSATLYLSCNFLYFYAFGLPLVASLHQKSPSTPVHLHIMDASSRQVAFIVAFMEQLAPMPFALSVERPELEGAPPMEGRCYYHAVRFIRFYQHLKTYRSPLWLMDVDAIINRDLQSLLTRLPGHDVALRVRPGRLEPWNQFNACMVGANTTPASLEYFRLIAAYVADFHQRGGLRWGIDQQAMYGVYADMDDHGSRPSLVMLGPGDVNYEHEETGYVWPNSGAAKMTHMARAMTPGAPPANPPTTKFDTTFEHYWQESARIARTIGVTL